MHYTLFISDLHLSDPNANTMALFNAFLKKCDSQIDALYILGDLFDYWIGDDDDSTIATHVSQALRELTIPTFLIRGNRDFLLSHRFAEKSKITLLPDPYSFKLYNTPTTLTHGDQLADQRWRYRCYRTLVHHPWCQHYFLLKSLSRRRAIAQALRKHSQKHNTTRFDVAPQSIRQQFKKTPASFLIHGHTHNPCIELRLPTQQQRLVLSDWHSQSHVLIISETFKYRLINLSLRQLTHQSWDEIANFH